MRNLWPIEMAVLEAAMATYPEYAEIIRRQATGAQVRLFENTGAGFFTDIVTSYDAPQLAAGGPLDCALGTVSGVHNAMGFLAFLDRGQLSTIEGYCLALDSTNDIDFEDVDFDLRPYRAGKE